MNEAPPKPAEPIGYKVLPDGKVVSNGCKCEWHRPERAQGWWDARRCPLHKK